uniref:ribonuclease H n=1 Tax=Leptobrachium leishanense TaxID=445787 RepID=A0A8C5Q9R4_9ANUR
MFTVLDLSNAFCSKPVDRETQPLLAFTFEGAQFCWKRLPQGFIVSAPSYCRALRETLKERAPPSGSVLLQYADDLLLCSPDADACKQDTSALLVHLPKDGHKVSLSKLQYCQPKVTYLGFTLCPGERHVSTSRIEALSQLAQPTSKTDMMSFLGMVNFCRHWIPDCSYYDNILRKATRQRAPDTLIWDESMCAAYEMLKVLLSPAPALGLPNYLVPFHLYCQEDCTAMAAVLAQVHGGVLRPTAFISRVLPLPVQGMPACLRAVAACVMAVEAAQAITLSHDTVLHTLHHVLKMLHNLTTQHVTAQRLSGYEIILRATQNLTVKYSSPTSGPIHALNSLLRLRNTPEDDEHDCLPLIHAVTSPRMDLMSTLIEGEHIRHIFVDGSCRRPTDNTYMTGYAVVELPDIIYDSGRLSQGSAQAAELIALTRACELFKDEEVTIYTDSRYAFEVVHDFGVLWTRRGFQTADGKTIAHADLITDLLEAIQLPAKLAVVKCKGHVTDGSFQAKENQFADIISKEAADTDDIRNITQTHVFLTPPTLPSDTLLLELQAVATPEDLSFWKSQGMTIDATGLLSRDRVVGLPKAAAPVFIAQFHGIGHRGIKRTSAELANRFLFSDMTSMVQAQISHCLTCARNNTQGKQVGLHEHLIPAQGPFQELQLDFHTHVNS